MPEPHPDAYQRHRDGALSRHVLCSGRYLESLWLIEFGADCPASFRRHERVAQIPEIIGSWSDPHDLQLESGDGPCMFADDSRIYVAWSERGGERRLQWTWSTDGVAWAPRSIVGGESTEHTPGFARFKDRLYLAWTGTDRFHRINVISSPDGVAWGGKYTFGEAQASSNDGPRLVAAGGELYLVWASRGSDKRLEFTSTRDGNTWAAKAVIPAESSDFSPGFARLRGTLFVAWTGTDDDRSVNVMLSEDNGNTWTNKRTFRTDPRRARSNSGPALLTANDRLYLGWSSRQNDGRMEWMSSVDGIDWQPKQVIGGRTGRSMALAYFKERFHVAWRGEDRDHHLGVLRGEVVQAAQTRRYVPWTSEARVVFGGGDNPLLRGGILLSTLAIEYIVKRTESSLRFAVLLFRYWLRCELPDANQQPTGFFLRCRNPSFTRELEQNASGDEVVGMVMGLYYLYLATESSHPALAARVRALTARLASNLQSWSYAIVAPGVATRHADRPRVQRGAFGLVFLQWALQRAFRRITGSSYEPSASNYTDASRALWSIYVAEKDRMKKPDIDALLGTMLFWSLQERHPRDLDRKWNRAFKERYHVSRVRAIAIAVASGIFGMSDTSQIELLWRLARLGIDAWANQSSLSIYNAVLASYKNAVHFAPGHIKWYNLPLAEHTLHYALDPGDDEAKGVAKKASAMLEAMLGRRAVISAPDDDFYAAVIAKGLISKHVKVGYLRRANEAIEAREQMWEDLPLAEPSPVSSGEWSAPIRWHNAASLTRWTARIGGDFAWERRVGERVFSISDVNPSQESGMDFERYSREVVHGHRDAVYEAGGLDYMFPRALMAYWSGSALDFSEKPLRPLRALTGLPLSRRERFLPATCGPRRTDTLLVGTLYDPAR